MLNEANAFTEWSTKQIHHFADIKIDVSSVVDVISRHPFRLLSSHLKISFEMKRARERERGRERADMMAVEGKKKSFLERYQFQ